MKKVKNNFYVHKSNINELLPQVGEEFREKVRLTLMYFDIKGIDYEVVKYNADNQTLSLIESPDWDTAMEPEVGDSWLVDLYHTPNKISKKNKRRTNPQIYHSKELFVADDYTGFDVVAAKQRTRQWKPVAKGLGTKIGNKLFWIELMKENGLPYDEVIV